MPPQTLAQMVRAKYPGAYDDLSDQDLESQVAAKYPGVYDDIPRSVNQKTAKAEDFMPATEPHGSAVGRFVGGAAEILNPVAIAQGLYGAVRHPLDTATGVLQGMGGEAAKAYALAKGAQSPMDYVEAGGHALAAAIPVLGPAAASAGEQIGSGDIAGGLGKGAGLLVPTMIPSAARGASRAAQMLPKAAADALESGAAARVADVMSPKVGANKVRFGNMAEKVAPQLAKDLTTDGAPLTRSGFHQQVASKLEAATEELDAASDARLSARTFRTQPLIDRLLAKRKEFTAQAVDASQPVRDADGAAVPVGKDVVPGPNSPRVAVIDRAINELRQLGPVTRYDPIKTLRQAYDQQAKVVYSPAVTADFLKVRGGALGAADVTGAMREQLAQWDPVTAKANAGYSLYKTADDVLSATAEIERTRPKVGRQIMARMTATLAGEHAAGLPGAAAGFVLGPVMDGALGAGMTTKLQTARLMTKLAAAIRSGDVPMVTGLSAQLRRIGVTAAGVVGAGRQADSQPATAPATP